MIFKTIKRMLDNLLELLIIISMAALTLDVLWQVFTRLVLKDPSTWTEELATFLLIWVAFLGSAVALNRGAHLGIDYLVNKLSERNRILTEIFVFLCVALFALCVMVGGGISLVIRTLELGQISPTLRIKMGYVYLAVPVSGFFILLYSVIGLVERFIAVIRHKYISKSITPDEQIRAY